MECERSERSVVFRKKLIIWFQEGCLVLLELERQHGDEQEEGDPRYCSDESHVDLLLHEAPTACQDRPKG